MPLEFAQLLLGGEVPYANGLIHAARCEEFAVVGYCNGGCPARVTFELAEFTTVLAVPQHDRSIAAGRGKRLAVRGEDHGADLLALAAPHRGQLPARGRLP